MENKEFRSILLNAMKEELAHLANEQKEQKKTRKLANRPKEKSLQNIVDEISARKVKITNLIFYYRWLLHGKKYWLNRSILSWDEYQYGKSTDNNRSDWRSDWYWSHVNDHAFYSGRQKYFSDYYTKFINNYFDKETSQKYLKYFYEHIEEIIFWKY